MSSDKLVLNNISIKEDNLQSLASKSKYGFTVGYIHCNTTWKVIGEALRKGTQVLLRSSMNIRAFKSVNKSNFCKLTLDELGEDILFTPTFLSKMIHAPNQIKVLLSNQ